MTKSLIDSYVHNMVVVEDSFAWLLSKWMFRKLTQIKVDYHLIYIESSIIVE